MVQVGHMKRLRWQGAMLLTLWTHVADGLVRRNSVGPHTLEDSMEGLYSPLLQRNFTVRYALLDPNPSSGYLREVGLPSLLSSHCLSETHLAPSLLAAEFIQVLPDYLVYTDSRTHAVGLAWIQELPEADRSRIRLVNLDEDPDDAARMQPFLRLGLDQKNLMSVRRTLADGKHLPTSSSRLLIGTDISFLSEPKAFISQASKLLPGQAMYMADDASWDGRLYRLSNYEGPQCAGLLGDFIFLTPGVRLNVALLQEKMQWYAGEKSVPERIDPPCDLCARMDVSAGLHGIDQFAMALALGQATGYGDVPGCLTLPKSKYSMARRPNLEVVHDKLISSHLCGYHNVIGTQAKEATPI
mmetsp:Transcript_63851/g.152283  ORF Transcript_63851/g.152283 Transcript_63851/m.152283 type:complete len:356 (+) Transcript_63851:118-1185(+)|eukprot:CAMPEP_0178443046 /NCGR_PEP_ID=MMETSP0689_2-20121128/38590_1 /TAXON_ID=160604 /ORGANISM="Amphidinium massartii, Strain CS-259" /LENGTH=355 /DNA_ID=CAMNT_0020066835 /DNA_START=102 /DNA_END=1169 /DNA_ORIENTATION=-